MEGDQSSGRGEVVFTAPASMQDADSSKRYAESFGIKYSPLARKIVTFNLVALCMMMTGILYLNQFDEGLISLREQGLESDARFMAEALVRSSDQIDVDDGINADTVRVFHEIAQNSNSLMQIFDTEGTLRAYSDGASGNSILNRDLLLEDEADEETGLIGMVSNRVLRIFDFDAIPLPPLKERLRFTEESMRSALKGNLRRARQSDSKPIPAKLMASCAKSAARFCGFSF